MSTKVEVTAALSTPKSYSDLTESQKSAADRLQAYLSDYYKKRLGTPKAVILCGNVGTGKSTICNVVLKSMCLEYITCSAADVRNQRTMQEYLNKATQQHNVAVAMDVHRRSDRNLTVIVEDIEALNVTDKGGLSEIVKCINPNRGKRNVKKAEKDSFSNTWGSPLVCICLEESDKRTTELKKDCRFIKVNDATSAELGIIFDNIIHDSAILCSPESRSLVAEAAGGDIRRLTLFALEYLHSSNRSSLESTWTKSKTKDSLANQTLAIMSRDIEHTDLQSMCSKELSLLPLMIHENAPYYIKTTAYPSGHKLSVLKDVSSLISAAEALDSLNWSSASWKQENMSGILSVDLTNSILSRLKSTSYGIHDVKFTSTLSKISLLSNTQKAIDAVIAKTERPDLRIDDVLNICRQVNLILSDCNTSSKQKDDSVAFVLQPYGISRADIDLVVRLCRTI